MKRKRVDIVALALVLALGVTGCGSGKDAGTGGTAGTPATAAGQAAKPGQPPQNAQGQPAQGQPVQSAQGQPAGGGAAASVSGRYVIVAEQSSASYIAREKFVNRELPNSAVGTTSDIKGELVLEGTAVKPSKVTVDLRTLKSDSERRDNAIKRRWLESEKYPYAEFSITGFEGTAPAFSGGQPAQFKLGGRMKVRDAERPVTFDVTGTVSGDTLVWTAKAKFKMSDFGVQPPDIANMLKVEDEMQVEVKITAKRG